MDLLQVLEQEGIGSIAFSPLAQGMLSDRYLTGIPKDSRAAKPHGFLRPEEITTEKLTKIRRLNEIAVRRGQKLAQMAVVWLLRKPQVTSVLIGASRIAHIDEAVQALNQKNFSDEELRTIDSVLAG
jgi:L-glyceraldehyde 3-phosphate reductase